MSLEQITASDITNWDSLSSIASSFEKRGLKVHEQLGGDNELVLQLGEDDFIVLVKAGPGETASDFKPENRSRHTNLVATRDFEEFTFLTRMRSWDGQQHGHIKHQKISFSKDQFRRDSGEKNTVLKKLNSFEYGSTEAITDTLYDTQQVVEEFYEKFEDLRMNLVREVFGIPDDRGDAKQRYVQVILDRMIFLYFIQEKRLLDRNPNYLHEQPDKVVEDGEDQYNNFYRLLFFDYLAEDKQSPNGDFGILPYLNGGLFAKNPVEEEFPGAKLGETAEETNRIFSDILEFLSKWNWNVDERLDIDEPKNLSPAILGHIFEQTVNQNEMGAYYTPEEITGFISRKTIHPYLLNQLNEAVEADYDGIDDLFGYSAPNGERSIEELLNSGDYKTENIEAKHVEALYHDILKQMHVVDPAVGSGAFLLAAQDVLVDVYVECIRFFKQIEQDGEGWKLASRTRKELEKIDSGRSGASLYAKRTAILNNLYGVDIEEGAVEICKLRLWLSMVVDLEDEPKDVEPLPNIDFNIRAGNSLIGFTEQKATSGEQSTLNSADMEAKLEKYSELVREYRHSDGSGDCIRGEIEKKYKQLRESMNQYYAETQSEPETGKRIQIEDYVEGVEDTVSSLNAAPNKNTTLCIQSQDGLGGCSDYLNEIGFTVYKYKARLPSPKISSTKIEELIDYLGDVFDEGDGWEMVVERECAATDFGRENIDAFHWNLEFPEVFLNSDGFDVVVGNPPYGAEIDPTQKPLIKNTVNYGCQGSNDSCEWFYERVFDLASSNSWVGYIVPKSIAYYTTWSDIRQKVLSETTLHSLLDVGLGFVGVNLETIVLVSELSSPNSNNQVDIWATEDTRSTTDNIPNKLGSTGQSYMQNTGKVIFRPINDRESNILRKIGSNGRRLGEIVDADKITRQLYVPDSKKKVLEPGENAFIEKNPWVQGHHLEDIWHCNLEKAGYKEEVERYAVPRVMLKVLRGSSLKGWIDPNGDVVGTEKLVNVPMPGFSKEKIAYVHAIVNHPCVSFYLQKSVFSETTESARVMDGAYASLIPLPEINNNVKEAIGMLSTVRTLSDQLSYDGYSGIEGERENIRDALDALIANCYLNKSGSVITQWEQQIHSVDQSTIEIFCDYYSSRFTTEEEVPSEVISDVKRLIKAYADMVEDWNTEQVIEGDEMGTIYACL